MPAYLTIDDAPSADLPVKTALLEECGVPALLFCEGRRLARHPDHARAAVESGFHLGNHTYSHTPASDLRVEEFREEVRRTEALLDAAYERAGVERPARVFRFPFGDRGGDRADEFQAVLADTGFRSPDADDAAHADGPWGSGRDWGWTTSVEDWTIEDAPALRDAVVDAVRRHDPDATEVVLFHDAGNVPTLFEAFLDALCVRGVEFADPVDLV